MMSKTQAFCKMPKIFSLPVTYAYLSTSLLRENMPTVHMHSFFKLDQQITCAKMYYFIIGFSGQSRSTICNRIFFYRCHLYVSMAIQRLELSRHMNSMKMTSNLLAFKILSLYSFLLRFLAYIILLYYFIWILICDSNQLIRFGASWKRQVS